MYTEACTINSVAAEKEYFTNFSPRPCFKLPTKSTVFGCLKSNLHGFNSN